MNNIDIDFQQLIEKAIPLIQTYSLKLLIAIVTGIVGFWVIKIISRRIDKVLSKSDMDATIRPFISNVIAQLLKLLLVISILGMLGVQMTSFIALIGAIGLAIGMALSGSLQNIAGGVMILLFKPFKVSDTIEAQGYTGTVSEIQVFNTILKTPDNKTIIIPNGKLSTSAMINYSTEARRRVDWTITIAYGDDVDKAKEVMKELCQAESRILPEPEVFMAVAALADSSVNITVRAWVKASDYWGVFFTMNENVYKSFSQHGLNIPYPQMDLHVHKVPSGTSS